MQVTLEFHGKLMWVHKVAMDGGATIDAYQHLLSVLLTGLNQLFMVIQKEQRHVLKQWKWVKQPHQSIWHCRK
jgi:hypothetical protein